MTNYVPRLYEFLEQLGRNNNREWFKEHRAQYDELRALWEADLNRLIASIAQWEPTIGRFTARQCAYRIYRDIRFSPDKSPFKTYFSAYFSSYGKNTVRAGYYLQMGPNPDMDAGLFGGLWCPDAAMLKKIRSEIVADPDEFRATVDTPQIDALFPGWCGAQLKTVPKGYDRNHPDADLLRLKDYGKWHPCDLTFFSDPAWPEKASEMFSLLKPFCDYLNFSLDN